MCKGFVVASSCSESSPGVAAIAEWSASFYFPLRWRRRIQVRNPSLDWKNCNFPFHFVNVLDLHYFKLLCKFLHIIHLNLLQNISYNDMKQPVFLMEIFLYWRLWFMIHLSTYLYTGINNSVRSPIRSVLYSIFFYIDIHIDNGFRYKCRVLHFSAHC